MSPFMKGVLGFVGCAGICGAAYAIGKHVGRDEALKDVEIEERRMAAQKTQKILIPVEQAKVEESKPEVQNAPEEKQVSIVEEQPTVTAAENVRKKHGIKNRLFGGINVIKDLLGGNAEDKQLTMTVENGDIIARISQKGG